MMRFYRALLVGIVLLSPGISLAQYDNPVSYMEFFNKQEEELGKDYMGYISAVTHSHSARKMERRRTELLKTVRLAHQNTVHMKAFKNDVTLRDAFGEYYSILLSVLREDYGDIVNMEEIAEQSYDNMEAYLLAQQRATEKLDEATKKRSATYKSFAENNKVKLVEGGDSKLSKKLEQSGKVSKYYNQLYLIFFKSNKQEYYLVDAFNSNNINAVEQNKSTLIKFADEGLLKLKDVKPFESDNSVIVACRKMLEFYKVEAEKKVPTVTDYLIKNEEFAKTKKIYDAKPVSDRTQEDVDTYNNMVNDINKVSQAYNQINRELNTSRSNLMDQWSATARKFLDSHTPK